MIQLLALIGEDGELNTIPPNLGAVLPVTLTVDIILFFSNNNFFPPGLRTGILLVLSLSWILVIPRLRYHYWRYELRDKDLCAIRGIYNRVHTIVPLRRIQHLDVEQDLIEENFNIARLVVHTAGTRSTDVVVPGLPYDEAVRLRDTVREFIGQSID
ncbi:MAG: PH domain-containing protein [Bacteroidetes bacterium]|nr:PH domain-containing protein [Bacteroidota bacterium]